MVLEGLHGSKRGRTTDELVRELGLMLVVVLVDLTVSLVRVVYRNKVSV